MADPNTTPPNQLNLFNQAWALMQLLLNGTLPSHIAQLRGVLQRLHH